MIAPASLIGFALAVGGTAWVTSAVLVVVVLSCRDALRRGGPELERAAAASALIVPAVASLAVGIALLGQSLAIPLLGVEDHCPAHVHHLHLCLFHGAAWVTRAWAVAAVVGGGAVVAVGLVRLVTGQIVAHLALRRLARVSTPVTLGDTEVLVAPSSRIFVFVGGIVRPRIFASSAAWDALDDDERRAAVAHERAHALRGDVARHLALCVYALVGAPLIARRALAMWTSATERLCDRRAAEESGDPSIVARALLTLARRGSEPLLSFGSSFAPAPDELALRVETLVADPPWADARPVRRVLRWLPLVLFVAALVFADALHHSLETLLGMI
jgi:Zn-dependent protease with chaperone function